MIEVDYFVIGAGIAGMTLYHHLQSSSVVIVDSLPGRYKIGESIVPPHFFSPELRPLLERARNLPSAADKLGTLFVTPEGVSFFHSFYDAAFTLHLDRRELEALYREHFAIPIRHERVDHIELESKVVRTNVAEYRARRQIIDCSGPAMVVARKLGITRELWPAWASWLYLDVVERDDERFWRRLNESGRPFFRYDDVAQTVARADADFSLRPSHMTMLTRIRDGVWNWQIPLYRSKLLSFGVVSRHGPVAEPELLDAVERHLGAQYTARRRRDAGSPHGKIHRRQRFAHAAQRFASPDWVLVGDAAFFGDPVYSVGTGVATNQAIRVASLASRWEDDGWKLYDESTRALFERAKRAYQHWYDGTVAVDDRVSSSIQSDFLNGLAFHSETSRAYIDMCSVAGPEDVSDPRHQGERGQLVTSLLPETLSRIDGWRLDRAVSRNARLELDWLSETGARLRMLVTQRRLDERCFVVAGPFGLSYPSTESGAMVGEARALFDEYARRAVGNQAALLRLVELSSGA